MKNIDCFTNYEISPVCCIGSFGDPVNYHYDGQIYFEACDIFDAVAFGVYAHFDEEGVVHLADYLTENQARKALKRREHLLDMIRNGVIEDGPAIIIDSNGLIDDVVHIARPEESYPDYLLIDLDCWESGECPVCRNDNLDYGPDDDLRCGICGANEQDDTKELISCYLNWEKKEEDK